MEVNGRPQTVEDFLTACKNGDSERVTSFIATGADVKVLQKGLFEAVNAQQVSTIARLLEYGVPVDRMSFIWATKAHSREIWSCFFDHGFDINSIEHGSSALRMSTSDPDLVTWLLDHGADPNLSMQHAPGRSWRITALKTALAENYLESMKVLVAHGAKLESDMFDTCLAPTSHRKIGVETLQFLLDSGLDPNVIVDKGRGTPLQLAVQRNMLEKARVLLQAGSSVTVRNKDGETPLEVAVSSGNQDMAALLNKFAATQ